MTLTGKLHSFSYGSPSPLRSDKCYTCGLRTEHLNSVPLQEDGPRRVLVCNTCEGKISRGEIKREESGIKLRKRPPALPGGKRNCVDILLDMDGGLWDMKTVYDDLGYARMYRRPASSWEQIAGPPEEPPEIELRKDHRWEESGVCGLIRFNGICREPRGHNGGCKYEAI